MRAVASRRLQAVSDVPPELVDRWESAFDTVNTSAHARLRRRLLTDPQMRGVWKSLRRAAAALRCNVEGTTSSAGEVSDLIEFVKEIEVIERAVRKRPIRSKAQEVTAVEEVVHASLRLQAALKEAAMDGSVFQLFSDEQSEELCSDILDRTTASVRNALSTWWCGTNAGDRQRFLEKRYKGSPNMNAVLAALTEAARENAESLRRIRWPIDKIGTKSAPRVQQIVFARLLAAEIQRRFGCALPDVVSKITSTVIGGEVTKGDIESWLRGAWANKSAEMRRGLYAD